MPVAGTPHFSEMPVNCLFCADDLVLVSESEEGLQTLLDKLHHYTSKWFLQINPNKTKCVTFSKYKKRRDNPMLLGETTIYSADTYCYLGIVLTNNESLNSAGHLLHDKGMKAMYAIIRKVYKHSSCKIRTHGKLI